MATKVNKRSQELTLQTMLRWAKKRLEKNVLRPAQKKAKLQSKAAA